jgi:lysophospholipase L1-like esterase
MRSLFVVLALALSLVGIPPVRAVEPTPLRILAVGDSITAPCASSPPGGWCATLSALLTQAGVPHQIRTLAQSGASCAYVSDRIVAELAAHPADLVLLNCGTGNAMVTTAEQAAFDAQWRGIFQASHDAGALVLPAFIMYSIDAIQQAQGRPWMLTRERAVNKAICSMVKSYPDTWRAGVLDLQVIPSTVEYIEGGTDGIHPNARGHQVYGALAYRALRGRYAWPDIAPAPLPARPRPHSERCSGLSYGAS